MAPGGIVVSSQRIRLAGIDEGSLCPTPTPPTARGSEPRRDATTLTTPTSTATTATNPATASADPARQERFYRAQLQLARRFDLPVILHVRRSADALLRPLREIGVAGGIAHAFIRSGIQSVGTTALRVYELHS